MLEKIKTNFTSQFFFRICVFFFVIYIFGASADIRWHTINAIRDHYFITPHVIMYLGVVGMMACFLFLKLKKENISIWVFFLFPFMSIFDELWHRFYGIELATSPMMFWSPAHWGFGLAIIYILFSLLKSKIETNKHVNSYVLLATMLWTWGFVKFILVPLFPFSMYESLHSPFNILSSIFLCLFIITILRIVNLKTIILPFLIATTIVSAPGYNFFTGYEYVYGSSSIFTLAFFPIFIMTVFDKYSLKYYFLYILFLISWLNILYFLISGVFSFQASIFSFAIGFAFVVLYFYTEEYLLHKFESRVKSVRELYE